MNDNTSESSFTDKQKMRYRTTNALIFPLKLIPEEEVLTSENLSDTAEKHYNPEEQKNNFEIITNHKD